MFKKSLIALALAATSVSAFASGPTSTLGSNFESFSTLGLSSIGQDSIQSLTPKMYWIQEQTLAIDTSFVNKPGTANDKWYLNGNEISKATYNLLNPLDGQTASSYFLAFDPKKSTHLSGSVTFESKILAVFDSKNALINSAVFENNSYTYNYPGAVGLESGDKPASSAVGGYTYSFNWTASSPGDYVRVITAPVPEPESYAMLLAGLGVMGAIARRRSQAQ